MLERGNSRPENRANKGQQPVSGLVVGQAADLCGVTLNPRFAGKTVAVERSSVYISSETAPGGLFMQLHINPRIKKPRKRELKYYYIS